MKKLLLSLFTLVLLFAFSTGVQAALFTFSGTDAGGTGSATMDIDISGTTLTLTLDNTSPIYLDYMSGDNAPGITGFGFDLIDSSGLISWELTAYNDFFNPVIIGSSSISNGEWNLNKTIAGVTLDFLPTTKKKNIDGALYNPLAVDSPLLPGGKNDVFFTTAVLTMDFNDEPDFDPKSPFVRIQNVGLDAEGSLKLYPVPEPATMLLFGSGLIGIAVSGKKRFKKRNG